MGVRKHRGGETVCARRTNDANRSFSYRVALDEVDEAASRALPRECGLPLKQDARTVMKNIRAQSYASKIDCLENNNIEGEKDMR